MDLIKNKDYECDVTELSLSMRLKLLISEKDMEIFRYRDGKYSVTET